MSSAQPVACSLTDPELRHRLEQLRTSLFSRTLAVNEDASGVTFTFDTTDTNVDALLNVVRLERQCCPFLHFRIEIAPQPGMLALHLGGNEEARAFINMMFVPLTQQDTNS
jgi:hypothetical protein